MKNLFSAGELVEDFGSLRLFRTGGIYTIMFTAGDEQNAVTVEALVRMREAFATVESDQHARVLVITGEPVEGAKHQSFSAGGNIKSFKLAADQLDDGRIPGETHWSRRIYLNPYRTSARDLRVPTIAMVNGDAIGVGLALVLGCDIAYAAKSARFLQGYVRAGLIAGMGLSDWVQKVGLRRALELALTQRMVSADEALEYGIINAVFADDELIQKTYASAERIAQQAPEALAQTKRALYLAAESSGHAMQFVEGLGHYASSLGAEHAEAVTALTSHRDAQFRDASWPKP